MKVKYIGKDKMNYLLNDNDIDLINGKVYEVLRMSKVTNSYIIIDESEEDYCYPASFFEIVEGSVDEFKK